MRYNYKESVCGRFVYIHDQQGTKYSIVMVPKWSEIQVRSAAMGNGFSQDGKRLLARIAGSKNSFHALENIICLSKDLFFIDDANIASMTSLLYFTEASRDLSLKNAGLMWFTNNYRNLPCKTVIDSTYANRLCSEINAQQIYIPGPFLPILPKGYILVIPKNVNSSDLRTDCFALTEKKWDEARNLYGEGIMCELAMLEKKVAV